MAAPLPDAGFDNATFDKAEAVFDLAVETYVSSAAPTSLYRADEKHLKRQEA